MSCFDFKSTVLALMEFLMLPNSSVNLRFLFCLQWWQILSVKVCAASLKWIKKMESIGFTDHKRMVYSGSVSTYFS